MSRMPQRWCRGGELNSLRRPFQGRALPVSYPGTDVAKRLYGCGRIEARGGRGEDRTFEIENLRFEIKIESSGIEAGCSNSEGRWKYVRACLLPSTCIFPSSFKFKLVLFKFPARGSSDSIRTLSIPYLQTSAQRLIDFAHPVFCFQDFARLCAVGRADDAVFFHDVDKARGAAVADTQAALQS